MAVKAFLQRTGTSGEGDREKGKDAMGEHIHLILLDQTKDPIFCQCLELDARGENLRTEDVCGDAFLCILPIEKQWEETDVERIQARQQPSGEGSHLEVPSPASDQTIKAVVWASQ